MRVKGEGGAVSGKGCWAWCLHTCSGAASKQEGSAGPAVLAQVSMRWRQARPAQCCLLGGTAEGFR